MAEFLAKPTTSAQTEASTTPLFSATPLELEALQALDLSLRLRLARATAWNYSLDDVRIDAELNSGRLAVKPIQARITSGGETKGGIELDTVATPPRWTGDLSLRGMPATALLGPLQSSLIDAPADLRFKLEARGNTLQSMAGTLSGHARLLVHEGRAQLREIDALVGGLSTITGQLLERDAKDARLNCVIADFPIERGVATTNVLLIDSAASTLRGDGQVNLGTETINLTFTPRPKRPTLSVAVPVHVRGPLRQPEFTPDRTASLTKLIGVAGIFVYPPAALATLGDLGTASDGCADLMRGGTPADTPDSVIGTVKQGVMSVTDGIGQGLKKLFGD